MTLTGERQAERSDRPGVDGDTGRSGTDREVVDALSPSEIVAVLRSRRRREVLRCLLAADGPVSVRTLVRRLAETETDPTLETDLLQQCQRVHESLRRTHLPVLDDRGIVDYRRGRDDVAPAPGLLALEPFFDEACLGRPE